MPINIIRGVLLREGEGSALKTNTMTVQGKFLMGTHFIYTRSGNYFAKLRCLLCYRERKFERYAPTKGDRGEKPLGAYGKTSSKQTENVYF